MNATALAYGDWALPEFLRTGLPLLDAFFAIFVVCFILVNFIAVYAGVSTLLERKIAAHMQSRVGPYQVGPHGSLQWIADALKLLLKEDIIPTDTDKILFRLAPYVVFAGSFACWVALPFAPGWSPASMNVGILYILAVSSSVVIGILMSGWSSGSKWALFGAMRSAAQIVSYEVPVGLTLLGMLLIYGTLDMTKISEAQASGHALSIFGQVWKISPDLHGGFLSWGLFRYPPITIIAFLVYYTAALAETNRTPFDIPEAESELVAGYHTEYSGMRFSFFFLSEYANMFVVSAIATTFFLGGWLPPFTNVTSAMTTVTGGVVLAGIGYGPKKSGWNAMMGFGIGAALGLVAGIYLNHEHPVFLGDPGSPIRFFEGLFWFMAKCFALVFVMMWLRWTLPRYRVDQLMELAWKKLTPLAFITLLAIGLLESAPQIVRLIRGGGS